MILAIKGGSEVADMEVAGSKKRRGERHGNVLVSGMGFQFHPHSNHGVTTVTRTVAA